MPEITRQSIRLVPADITFDLAFEEIEPDIIHFRRKMSRDSSCQFQDAIYHFSSVLFEDFRGN